MFTMFRFQFFDYICVNFNLLFSLLLLLLPSQSPGGGGGGRGGSGLDSVNSLDDLLLLLHPESSRLQLCLRRRSQNPTPALLHSGGGAQEEEEELWGRPREEALRRSDGVFEGMGEGGIQPLFRQSSALFISSGLQQDVCTAYPIIIKNRSKCFCSSYSTPSSGLIMERDLFHNY